MADSASATPPAEVLDAFGSAGATTTCIPSGLINQTYAVDGPRGRFILQRLNPIFAPEVNEDIDAVTAHLGARGMSTPTMVRTRDGHLWTRHDGHTWRAMTFVDGRTFDRAPSPAHAAQAGYLLGRFHDAMADFDHRFKAQRLGVHDTPRHLAHLESTLADHGAHRLADEVTRLSAGVFEAIEQLPALSGLPERVVHGDPKISNIIFDEDDRAVCMIDLDTVAKMALPLELGDALRSWCNTADAGEDCASPTFSLALFESAVRGYAASAKTLITPEETDAIVTATATIMAELAARFAADALTESYFGWDPTRFDTRGDHNLLRARGQLALCRSLLEQGAEARAAVREAFDQDA